MDKKIGIANQIASDHYGLNKGEMYLLDSKPDKVLVYDIHGSYVGLSRIEAFDNVTNFQKCSGEDCLTCASFNFCSL